MICPFCETEYEHDQLIIEKMQVGLKEFQYVYSCPNCEKELSDHL